ncbi:MAG: type I polyketide synthase, partial [bacterium]
MAELLSQCAEASLSGAEVYAAFGAAGLAYGAGHRGLAELRVGRDGTGRAQALGRLVLPEAVRSGAGEFLLHPGLMDAALQTVLGLGVGDGGQGRPYLPFAVEDVRIWGPTPEQGYAFVRFSAGSSPQDAVRKLDVDVCDEAGKVCVRLGGFSVRVLEAGLGVAEPSTLVITPSWRARPVGEDAAFESVERHVLLGSGLQALGAGLGSALPGVKAVDLAEDYAAAAVQVIGLMRGVLQGRPSDPVLVQVVVEPGRMEALAGALKTGQLENPNLVGQVIAVEPGLTAVELAARLEETGRAGSEAQVRYLDGERRALSWDELAAPAEAAEAPWRDGGVYLITGGAGGLGAILAREIALKAREPVLVLTGRSPLDGEREDLIAGLEALGARAIYRSVDVSDEASAAGLVAEIVEQHGALNGIIHSAGVLRDSLIINKSDDDVRAVLSPKVAGIQALDAASKDTPLDVFVLFASLAGTRGNPGQADYAAANAYLDAFAEERSRLVARGLRSGRVLSIAWPLWRDGGMGVDETVVHAMRSQGVHPLPTEAALTALYQAWAAGVDQVGVLHGDRHRLLAALQPKPPKPVRRVVVSAGGAGDETLAPKAELYLARLFSQVLKLPAKEIDPQAQLESYGVDSILAMQLTNALETEFG